MKKPDPYLILNIYSHTTQANKDRQTEWHTGPHNIKKLHSKLVEWEPRRKTFACYRTEDLYPE